MREILFRGKRIDNGEWVEGWLYKRFMYPDNMVDAIQVYDGSDFGHVEYHPVISETVGQYTGLKDRNGVRIFEGDVIKTHSGLVGQIVFGNHYDDEDGSYSNGWFLAGRDEAGDNCTLSLDDKWRGHMIIGNIHDNSELLSVEGE